MQWKGPFEIVTTVGINDYRINMGEKEETFHANLLKGYIARDQDAQPSNYGGKAANEQLGYTRCK
ncbi:Zinc finger protein, partial [Plakobranchus ocellatus]